MKCYCSYCGKSYSSRGTHTLCFAKSLEDYKERVKLDYAGDNPYKTKDNTRKD